MGKNKQSAASGAGGTVGTVQKKYMSKKEIWSYAFGLFGLQIVVGYMTTYQAQFFDRVMGADITLVGTIILVGKLASAIFDPAIGNLIDRTHSKMGKLKPFILYSVIPLLLLSVLIFSPFKGITGTPLYMYIFFTYLLWSIAMTVGDIPSQAMSAVLTPNNDERNKVITLGNTLKTIGLVMPNVIMPIVTMAVPGGAFFLKGVVNAMEFFYASLVSALIGCAMFVLIAAFNKERIPYKVEKLGLKDMANILKNNKYLMLIFLSYILGFGRMAAATITAQTAYALLGTETQTVIVGLSTAIGGMISMLIAPKLVQKFGEKKAFIGMALFNFAFSEISCLLQSFIGYDNGMIYVAYAFMLVRALGCGSYYIIPLLMVADAVDYYELKTGKRTEGVSYAVNSFAIKVTMALAAFVGLAIIGAAGYSAQIPFADISIKTKNWVYFAFVGFPGLCYLLSTIPIFFYDLTSKKKEDMHVKLIAMRAENAAAEMAYADGVVLDAENGADTNSGEDSKEDTAHDSEDEAEK